MTGDPAAGAAVFKKLCAPATAWATRASRSAPTWPRSTDKSPEALLVAILDPNRAFEAKYTGFTVATADGRVLTGLIASETATAVTLRRQEGKEDVLLRSDIEEMAASGQSLMPEGLEKDLKPPRPGRPDRLSCASIGAGTQDCRVITSMAKPTDVRPVGAELYFLPIKTRMPLKFGPEITTEVTCARVRLTVADAPGPDAPTGWGETPLSASSGSGPARLGYEERHQVLEAALRSARRGLGRASGDAGPPDRGRPRVPRAGAARAARASSTRPSGREPSRCPGWRPWSAARPSTWPCTTPTACSTACRPTRPTTPGT